MRLEEFYKQPAYFCRIVNQIQKILRNEKNKRKEQFDRNVITYVMNRLTEIKNSIYFSYFISNAIGDRPHGITDIDKIVYINREPAAIFELKVRRRIANGYIEVNWIQYEILKVLWEQLNIPILYLVKLPDHYRLIKLNIWHRELTGNGLMRDWKVKIPIKQGIPCETDVEVINALRSYFVEAKE